MNAEHEVTLCPTLDPKRNVARCSCGIELFVSNLSVPGYEPEPWKFLGMDNYISIKMKELHQPYRRKKDKSLEVQT